MAIIRTVHILGGTVHESDDAYRDLPPEEVERRRAQGQTAFTEALLRIIEAEQDAKEKASSAQ